MIDSAKTCVAFCGHRRLAEGPPPAVARSVRHHLDRHPDVSVLVFSWPENAPVDLDLRGTPDEVAARTEERERAAGAAADAARRGRPRLGVVGREVTLLPRHWDWLAHQPGGASVTLRKLVEAARKEGARDEAVRRAQDRTHRFLYALAGDLPGFEEAARALYAWDLPALEERIADWPEDLRTHVRRCTNEAARG